MEPTSMDLDTPSGWRCVTYAENQPEYLPLPTLQSGAQEGRVVSRWRLTWRERLRMILTGHVYLQVLTFHTPLQPVLLSVVPPTLEPAWGIDAPHPPAADRDPGTDRKREPRPPDLKRH